MNSVPCTRQFTNAAPGTNNRYTTRLMDVNISVLLFSSRHRAGTSHSPGQKTPRCNQHSSLWTAPGNVTFQAIKCGKWYIRTPFLAICTLFLFNRPFLKNNTHSLSYRHTFSSPSSLAASLALTAPSAFSSPLPISLNDIGLDGDVEIQATPERSQPTVSLVRVLLVPI